MLQTIRKMNDQIIEEFRKRLLLRRYSSNTIKTYTEVLKVFFHFHEGRPLAEITNVHVEHFCFDYILKRGLSSSYQNQVINAIKLFYRLQFKLSLEIENLQRPKREKNLPNVLSKEEIKRLLVAPTNIKHQVMLSLFYACGLRRGELLNLRISDIQSDRQVIHIKQSKGKKDRIVPISLKVLEMLRSYYKTCRPKFWLFEGQHAGEHYSERSLQLVLKHAVTKAKINKPVTLHWLRHSYARHLLESGTDLRYIQELLGHSSSRTTEIYTHVSTQSLQKIRSPFDDL